MGDVLSCLDEVELVLLTLLHDLRFTISSLQVLRETWPLRGPKEFVQFGGAHIGINQQNPAATLANQSLSKIPRHEGLAFRRGRAGDQESAQGLSLANPVKAGAQRAELLGSHGKILGAGEHQEIGGGIPNGFDAFHPQLVKLKSSGIRLRLQIRKVGGRRKNLGLSGEDLDRLTRTEQPG